MDLVMYVRGDLVSLFLDEFCRYASPTDGWDVHNKTIGGYQENGAARRWGQCWLAWAMGVGIIRLELMSVGSGGF